MEFDLYKKIIDEAKDFIFDINLAHRGESMLHPQLIEFIDYANKNNLYTRLHSNGSLLSEEMAYKIIESGLDRLSFSFDGFTKEKYEKIRIGGNFDTTIKNILRFLEIKKATKSKKPETALEIINFDQKNPKKFVQQKDKFKWK